MTQTKEKPSNSWTKILVSVVAGGILMMIGGTITLIGQISTLNQRAGSIEGTLVKVDDRLRILELEVSKRGNDVYAIPELRRKDQEHDQKISAMEARIKALESR